MLILLLLVINETSSSVNYPTIHPRSQPTVWRGDYVELAKGSWLKAQRILISWMTCKYPHTENNWLARPLRLGTTAQLHVIDPCPRCVATTLVQGNLPRELEVLRTVGQHNRCASVTLAPGVILPAVAGMYAKVLHGGKICRGDAVGLGL